MQIIYQDINEQHPDVTKLIKQDLQDISTKAIQNFRFIRTKSGVYVYSCLYDGNPAVVKYFEKEDDRREILNYRILAQHGIPTINAYALGNATVVLEDITASETWRLGILEDLSDVDVATSLAGWYFTFHENGTHVSELDTLYFEYAQITEKNLNILAEKLPEAKELIQLVLTYYNKLYKLIYKPSFTLTYNDFYWVNFVVRKDKKAAMMFDYNLLGKGYRYSDFRNVCCSMSEEARTAFTTEYNRLYYEKHGCSRMCAEKLEQSIDEVASVLFELITAFTEFERIPNWATDAINEVQNGNLLSKTEYLLSQYCDID